MFKLLKRSALSLRSTTSLNGLVSRRLTAGAWLTEQMFVAGIMIGVAGAVADFLWSEYERLQASTISAEYELALLGSRTLIANRYSDIINDLYAAAGTSGSAIKAYSISDLESAGVLPQDINIGGALKKKLGQDYALLVRLVDAASAAVPQPTLQMTALDPGSTGSIDPMWVNNDEVDGEAEIEAVLVSYGAASQKRSFVNQVALNVDAALVGAMADATTAKGMTASYTMDVSPYLSATEAPALGSLVGIVALSGYGVIGHAEVDDPSGDELHRCANVDPSSVEYIACMAGNDVYTDIVFNPYDTNGDTIIDYYPSIRNLSLIDCGNGGAMGDGTEFIVDCPESRFTGDLTVEGADIQLGDVSINGDEIAVDGDTFVSRATGETVLSGDRVVLNINGGVDLAEGILDARYVVPEELIAKPICPAFARDGVTPVAPRLYAQVSGFSDQYGRPIAGVRAWGSDEGANWRLKMIAYIAQDECANTAASPLPVGTPLIGDVPDHAYCSSQGAVPDGDADVWWVGPSNGIATIFTRCY